MWISKVDYTALVAKSAGSDWLLARVNQLERELAHAKYQVTGLPQPIPIIHRENTPRAVDDPAEVSFEDMGDDNAIKLGL